MTDYLATKLEQSAIHRRFVFLYNHIKGSPNMPLTPQNFVSKWEGVPAREKQTCQELFIDLGPLVGHQPPNDAHPAWLERWPSNLRDEGLLGKLLALNLERGKQL
jgi:hypothetical protein